MKYKENKKLKGFTLVELLVVLSIIAVLLGVLLVSFQGTRVTARDGRRKTDLELIRGALEMYRGDCGLYPSSLTFGDSLVGPTGTPCSGNNYIARIPKDPLDPSYNYYYAGSLNVYTLCSYLEGGDELSSSPCTGSCGNDTCGTEIDCRYKTCNP